MNVRLTSCSRAILAGDLYCYLKSWVVEHVVCLVSKFLAMQFDCNMCLFLFGKILWEKGCVSAFFWDDWRDRNSAKYFSSL